MTVFTEFFASMTKRPGYVSDLVPWRCYAAPGIVRCKDRHALLRTYVLRGYDPAGEPPEVQGARMLSANDALRRMTGAWTIHSEARRAAVTEYPPSTSPYAIAQLIDADRRQAILHNPGSLETQYFLSLTWTPPGKKKKQDTTPVNVEDFRLAADACVAHLQSLLAWARPTSVTEENTYLHSTVSDRPHSVAAFLPVSDIDVMLCDSPYDAGAYPDWDAKLGEMHLRVCTVLGYPAESTAVTMQALERLNIPYRWVTRWNNIEKHLQDGMLHTLQRDWGGAERSIAQIFTEWFRRENIREDLLSQDATNKLKDLGVVRQEVGADIYGLGNFSTTILTWGGTAQEANERIRLVQHTLEGMGFTVKQEGAPGSADIFGGFWPFNYLLSPQHTNAWLSTLPGQTQKDLRQTVHNSLTLAHLMPGLRGTYPGPVIDEQLQQRPWFLAHTDDHTLIRIVNHVRTIGHHGIVGPTGVGKSTFLWFGNMMWTHYRNAQLFTWDKDKAGRLPTLMLGGHWYDLGTMSFQPLRRLDTEYERGRALHWLLDLCAGANVLEEDGMLQMALAGALRQLGQVTTQAVHLRTLSGLLTIIADQNRETELNSKRNDDLKPIVAMRKKIRNAILPYTRSGGDYGWLLDGEADTLRDGNIHTFELGSLLEIPRFAKPVLTHLHAEVERHFSTEKPTRMPMDEAAILLMMPANAELWEERLQTTRKKGVSLEFYIHNLEQIFSHKIGPLLVTSIPTWFYFPTPAAGASYIADYYRQLKLTEEEIQGIARGVPNRDIYYVSELGRRPIQLTLSPFILDSIARNDDADHARMDKILAQEGREGFCAGWLRALGYSEQAQEIEQTRRGDNGKASACSDATVVCSGV